MSEEPDKPTGEESLSSSLAENSPAEDFAVSAASGNESAEQIIAHLREQNRQLTDQLLRTRADMDNARKRLAKERDEFRQYSLFSAMEALLPVLDGFQLALNAEGGGEEYRRGVEIIYLQFLGTLQRLGLEPIDAVGKPFDPNVHEAIATVETDTVPDQYVLDEMQSGFFFKKRLLRPAKVRVARQPATAEPSIETDA
jgi:molecular chaperone GrpE